MTRAERWGWRVLRGVSLLLGGAWAVGLMWVGCVWWEWEGGRAWLGPLGVWVPWSAGLYVWMFLVSDELCPAGARRVGGAGKAAAAMVFWAAVVGVVAGWVW
jgi:hypothetical protein